MARSENKNNYKIVNFDAVKPTKEEINVRFKTKDGKTIVFPATKIVYRPITVKFKSKK